MVICDRQRVKIFAGLRFGMIFYIYWQGFNIFFDLNWRYLAFIVLLAGWVWFCYNLFSDRIYATIHPPEAPVTLVRMDELPIPFAFNWGSALPLAGKDYDTWIQQFSHLDSTGLVVVIHGGYFRDEAPTLAGLRSLGIARINSLLRHIQIDSQRIITDVIPMEINADVRSRPFAAVTIESIAETDLLSFTGDTAQLCFPLADSLTLPPYSLDQLLRWVSDQTDTANLRVHITGTADGTGIAESSDRAVERAEVIEAKLLQRGWPGDKIRVTAEQRNNPHTLHNRCVLVYFEPAD